MTYVYETESAEVHKPQTVSDPMTTQLLGSAQDAYMSYYQAHGENALAPLGVVVDRKTGRAQLIFTGQPILLPQESFIPTDKLGFSSSESDEYWE